MPDSAATDHQPWCLCDELQGPSWRERVAAKVAEKCLFYLGKRAWDRGDRHDYGHALGALNAGACGIGCSRDA